MLSLAIKNSILVTLIILIIHFLFKNVIIERDGIVQPLAQPIAQPIAQPNPITQSITQPLAQPIAQPTPIEKPKETFTNNEEELYKYLFQEELLKPIEKPKTESTSLETRKDEADEFDNMIIGKYDGESVMNGGNLMNGISGVNNFSMSYETFK